MEIGSKDIFLSYRREDNIGGDGERGIITELAERLRGDGFRVFFDEEDLDQPGSFSEGLHRAIQNSYCFVPILSQAYLRFRDSDTRESWCLWEVVKAISTGAMIVPLLLPDFDQGPYFRDRAVANPVPESEITTEHKEQVRQILCTRSGIAWGKQGWYDAFRKRIYNQFCDSRQVPLFADYLRRRSKDAIQLYACSTPGSGEDLYVPLAARRCLTASERETIEAWNRSRQGEKRSTEPTPVAPESLAGDILSNRLAIVTGEAGQGKTVLLRKLQAQLSSQAQAGGLDRELPFPIYVESRDLVRELGHTQDFSDCLMAAADLKGAAARPVWEAVRRYGTPLLLINGLDEVRELDARRLLEKLDALLADCERCRVLFSSRPRGAAAGAVRLQAGEIREYRLDALDEGQLSVLMGRLFARLGEDTAMAGQCCQAIVQREETEPDYREISRNPFYAYPLAVYFQSHGDLPGNSISLLETFTTQILTWEKERSGAEMNVRDVKYALGYLALEAYLAQASGRSASYTAIDLAEAVEETEEQFPRTALSEDFLSRVPYFVRDRGFVHDTYAAYSAAFYWWTRFHRNLGRRSDRILHKLVESGSVSEKAVGAIVALSDWKSRDEETVQDVVESILETSGQPPYELLCPQVRRCSRYGAVCREVLLRHMFRRGIDGIMHFDSQTYTCSQGANPYNELFYYAVVYDYGDAVAAYQRQGTNEEERCIESVLLRELQILFDLPETDCGRNAALEERLKSASSLRRMEGTGREAGETRGHVNAGEAAGNDKWPDPDDRRAVTSLLVKGAFENPFSRRELRRIRVEKGHETYFSRDDCLIDRQSRKLLAGCRQSRIPSDGSVTAIARGAFAGCTALGDIAIPRTVTVVEEMAFAGCSGLQELVLPEGLTELKSYAFSLCTGLRRLTIPESVKSIGSHSFEYCQALEEITLPNWMPLYTLFSGELGGPWLEELQKVTLLRKGNACEAVWEGGCLIDRRSRRLLRGSSECVIPEDGSVAVIGEGAFWECEELTEIKIPEGVLMLQGGSFAWCSYLRSVHLPASLRTIAPDAFGWCDLLETVDYAGTREQWQMVDSAGALSAQEVRCADGRIPAEKTEERCVLLVQDGELVSVPVREYRKGKCAAEENVPSDSQEERE